MFKPFAEKAKARLFLSIPLNDLILTSLENYQKKYIKPGLRWLPKENLHITVYFLGNIEISKIEAVVASLRQVFMRGSPFMLLATDIIFAPPKRPRMIWATFAPNPHYETLVKEVACAVSSFVNLKHEQRQPVAHVTLARFKNPILSKKLKLDPWSQEALELSVESLELMASKLLKEGPRYSVIERFSL
ncbi:MAG: RNA 2',3'-cyclic phosphodiesterase [Deltaproteobacteria bacterium]|nr:RNA 2',3'-cyclic phosphodiesterase [Deltaproteobacteria bacterium]